MEHVEFEKKLMKMLLSGDDEVLNKLRKQYEVAKIASREFSDAGFYTSFLVENRNDLCIKNKSFHIGDVDGNIDGIEGAVGFVLYVKNGYITLLEGYTNAVDTWPKSYDEIVLSYDSGEIRNIENLRTKWV
ncbi:hypothetical protein EPD62_002195 [Acetivibrio thermocellus]|uniref:hypothetical protein n=1 Tax=Acetivibrio thermocellus TaxID=1515 RepID=UPI0010A698BB|nr:hypothetical protein [Acetivibrio thermocellus]THJ76611.1 hypothetical protein EPD62_15635 [Acetivibrio thermocellus]